MSCVFGDLTEAQAEVASRLATKDLAAMTGSPSGRTRHWTCLGCIGHAPHEALMASPRLTTYHFETGAQRISVHSMGSPGT